MTPHILLEQLRNLLQSIPPLEGHGDYTHEQYTWLGKANALMSEWNKIQSIPFKAAVNSLIRNADRRAQYGIIVTMIHDVITRIENSLPRSSDQVFGPGAAYDFFKALNDLVASATSQIFIVDPYLDAQIFDGYLNGKNKGISVRLLTCKYVDNVRVAAEKYRLQYGASIEVRVSTNIHDRVIFVDEDQCWVVGASIKDAALKKPTYLAPISADVIAHKRKIYDGIWAVSTPI